MKDTEIKVAGIGVAGNNILNKMIQNGMENVEFIGISESEEILDKLQAESKIMYSENLSKEVQNKLKDTDLLFILTEMSENKDIEISCTVAETAKSMGILTVTIASIPVNSVEDTVLTNIMKKTSDVLILLPLQKLFETGSSESLLEIYKKKDEIFIKSVEMIAELIKEQGIVNLDLDDVKSILKDSGLAMTGFGKAKEENRAVIATNQILNTPFVKDYLKDARKILSCIKGGPDIGLHEIQEVAEIISKKADNSVEFLWGFIMVPEMKDNISVSLLVTDFRDKDLTDGNSSDDSRTTGASSLSEEDDDFSEFIVPPFFGE